MLKQATVAGLESAAFSALRREVAREVDPADVRILVARKLLAQAGARPQIELLETARRLAEEAMKLRPGDPEALWIRGASVALERLTANDPALVTRYRDWEEPLLVAVEHGGSAGREARPILAAVYLATWNALSPAKKAFARELLREAFLEPDHFHRLVEPAIRSLGGVEPLVELVPDRSWAWQKLRQFALQEGELRLWLDLEARERAARAQELQETLHRANELVSKGQGTRARQLLDPLWASLPVELGQVAALQEILNVRPPGPTGPERAAVAVAWLELDRDLEHLERGALPPELRRKLYLLARSQLATPLEAEVLLRMGDRAQAERLARRAEDLSSATWGRYLLLRARLQWERGEQEAARKSFGELPRDVLHTLPAALLARRLGSALPTLPLEEPWISPPSTRRDRVTWALWVPPASFRLLLKPAKAVERNALLEAYWDGRRLPWVEAPVGASPLPLPVPLEPGAHLLELGQGPESLRWGTLELEPPRASGTR